MTIERAGSTAETQRRREFKKECRKSGIDTAPPQEFSIWDLRMTIGESRVELLEHGSE
jgi:hypothetical protein